ncbi:hypothetical protein HXA34_17260 [Salipaludibacillus agaradhaerens]|uniref:hypothetical protein n=1 Tax=Salipaludibacillus agaradhaerens TaxID=76935 RepID=UPI002150B627|nr:hypothetical protein [Salipaludibacillus agaradhaerens]MCR6108044.1 hypothetical protein [Salipaludibacillus agaradhaerens]MCR6120070.1 hypothetical protein [Salipaludibacillus agaradhaerens]
MEKRLMKVCDGLSIISVHDRLLECIWIDFPGDKSFPLHIFHVMDQLLKKKAISKETIHEMEIHMHPCWKITIKEARINNDDAYVIYVKKMSSSKITSVGKSPREITIFKELARLTNRRYSHQILNIFTPIAVMLQKLSTETHLADHPWLAYLLKEIHRGKAYLQLYNDFYRTKGETAVEVMSMKQFLEGLMTRFCQLCPEMEGWLRYETSPKSIYIQADLNKASLALFPLFEKMFYESMSFDGITLFSTVRNNKFILSFPIFHLNYTRDPEFILCLAMAERHLQDAGVETVYLKEACEVQIPVYKVKQVSG